MLYVMISIIAFVIPWILLLFLIMDVRAGKDELRLLKTDETSSNFSI